MECGGADYNSADNPRIDSFICRSNVISGEARDTLNSNDFRHVYKSHDDKF